MPRRSKTRARYGMRSDIWILLFPRRASVGSAERKRAQVTEAKSVVSLRIGNMRRGGVGVTPRLEVELSAGEF